jgi:DUF438 domain-containing protein
MSQIINNREYRQKVMKEIILELHGGKKVDDVKERFHEIIKDVGPTEITEMEQALIREGMPAENIKKLCDVHVSVFRESLDEIKHAEEIPGHPIYTFKKENREIENVIESTIRPAVDDLSKKYDKSRVYELLDGLNLLMDLDKHYSRKENLLFPYLEKYDITGPPTVMWGIDDDIRAKIKECIKDFKQGIDDENRVGSALESLETVLTMIGDMIYKEENILFPMSLETLTEEEWKNIMEQSDEIGFSIIEPEHKWKPNSVPEKEKMEQTNAQTPGGNIKFDTGILSLNELNQIFRHIPFDITFVDKDDVVKYFSPGKDRIFTRTKTIVGRKVQFCHPPASVHVVEKIVDDFKNNRRDDANFWIQLKGMFIYIRYIAVRDSDGNYLGTLEVSQNITDIKKLDGEKRLLDD